MFQHSSPSHCQYSYLRRGVEQKLRAWAAGPGVERGYPTQQRSSGRLAYTTTVHLYLARNCYTGTTVTH